MERTVKEPKHLLIGGLIVAAIYFYPTLYRLAVHHTITPPATAKASTATPKPAAKPIDPLAQIVTGKWSTTGMVDKRSSCTVQIEISPNAPPPDGYSGYLTLRCIQPYVPFWNSGKGAPAVNQLAPVSAMMTGSNQGNALQLHAQKAIGGSCPITAATLTPFGTRELAIQWKDGCGDGQLILRR